MKKSELKAAKKIFRYLRGSQVSLARDLGISPVTISRYLSGHFVSARIEKAVRAKVNEFQLSSVASESDATIKTIATVGR